MLPTAPIENATAKLAPPGLAAAVGRRAALLRVRPERTARAAGDEPHRIRARPGASRRRNRLLAASAGRAGRPAPDAPAGDRRPAHPWPGVLPAVLRERATVRRAR